MKTYIVYYDGIEVGYIKAGSHNSAETKAKKKAEKAGLQVDVSVTYTEL